MSHSRGLAQAAVELGREVLQGQDVRLEVAAGLDDGSFGTDAVAVLEAVERADRGDGVVVLMDLGSAVLSAELALEMLDDDARDRVLLCDAPLVEGLVAACVAASGGADRDAVAAEARAGLAGKQAHLGTEPPSAAPSPDGPGDDGVVVRVVVEGPHGLHARPAARLVTTVQACGVPVSARNASTGSAWVSASSLAQVAVLGVRSGQVLELRASGHGAQDALDRLVALAARGFDDAPTDRPQAPAGAPVTAPGGSPVPASPGIGVGPSRSLRRSVASGPYEPSGTPEVEQRRLTTARDAAREALRHLRARTATAVGRAEAEVFDAHLLLLDDDDLLVPTQEGLAAGLPAPQAWSAAVAHLAETFARLPDPYLASRADDVRAVGDEVLRALVAPGAAADPGAGAAPPEVPEVLLAADLTPAEAAVLDPSRTAGLVLAGGSPSSHAVLLVRALGVPAVVGAGEQVLDTPDGTLVALDGATGELALGAGEDVVARLRAQGERLAAERRTATARAAEPARTADGVDVHVVANLGSLDDARLAARCGADGAGLVRTEFLFLDRDRAPDAEEQESVYRALAEALGGRRMVLRTLDVGGDKPLPYVPAPPEANPFLGLRGLRLSLAVPGLLAEQLLAVVRVARETPVSVMFPMVTTVDELLAARRTLDAAVRRAGGGTPPGLRVGMMVEVPAAALKTAAFAGHVDFLSVGTNDLTQYALAAERGNPAVAGLSDSLDPGVLRLLAAVCEGAGVGPGRPDVAVCGELAADPAATALLLGLGVRELSVAPRAVPLVKQSVRQVDIPRAAAQAERALAAHDAAAVRGVLLPGAGSDPAA